MLVHTLEQSLFNFLIFGKSRFPPKKFITFSPGDCSTKFKILIINQVDFFKTLPHSLLLKDAKSEYDSIEGELFF